jgi:prepilin-type N-terminal cleavage/methylation domain-containing protein
MDKLRRLMAVRTQKEPLHLYHKGSRRGFTLVEMIVTLLIVGIVIAISVTFLTTGANFLNRTEENASDKTVAEKAAEFIKGQLLYASEVKAVESASGALPAYQGGRGILYVGNADGTELAHTGRLFYRSAENIPPLDVLGDAAYRSNELAFAYNAIVNDSGAHDASAAKKSALFEAKVMALRDGRLTQEAEQVFRMYNIGRDSEPKENGFVASWRDEENDDESDGPKLFYLLVTPPQQGYAVGLIAHFDAKNNAIVNGEPGHNASEHDTWYDISGNGNNMALTFQNYNAANPPVRDKTIYFSGAGDYGVVNNLDLSRYEAVTVEVCFDELPGSSAMLFEYARDGAPDGWNANTGTFGVIAKLIDTSTGEIHNIARVGANTSAPSDGARYFTFPADTNKLKTMSFVMSNENKTNGRMAFVNGARGTNGKGVDFLYYSSSTGPYPMTNETTEGTEFGNYTFSVAARLTLTRSMYYKGMISSVRIYGRALNADEIARNAEEDKARFGR